MGQDKLEFFVKEKIGQYESPIDTNDLWNDLQGKIESTPVAVRSKMPWKWLFFGIGIIGIVGLAYFAGMQTASNNPDQSSLIVTQENQSSMDYASSETNTIPSNNIDQSHLLNAEESKKSGNTIINSEDLASKNSANSASIQTSQNNSPSKAKHVGSISHAKKEVSQVVNANAMTPVNGSGNGSDIYNNIEVDNIYTKESFTSQSSGVLAEHSNIDLSAEFFELDLLNFGILKNDNNRKLEYSISALPKKVNCPSFGGTRGSNGAFSVELQAIPLYSTPRFVALNDFGEDWVARKKSTESYLEAFQINLVGRYQLRNGLYAHAGIGYGQIDEKFQFNTEDIAITKEDNIPIIIIKRPNGMNDTIRGSREKEVITTLNAETYNYHRMIELPFAVGYEFTVSQTSGIYFDFGGSVNLSTFRKGYLVVDDIDIISFDDATRPVYKTSTGFKLNGGLGLRYHLANGLSFSVGPEMRYHMSNWIRDEHPIEQRYFDIGLRLATSVRF